VKLQFKKRRLIPAVLAILVLVIGSGVAYAYWTASGTGTGNGTAAAGVSNLTAVVNPASPLTAMYPGDSNQTISIKITNPSTTESVHVTSVSASVVDTTNPLCDATDFTVTGSPAAVGQDISALGNIIVAGPQIQFNNKITPQDACKGVTVHLSFTIA